MKEYYYIDWTMDWADEGDVCGFEIIDKEELVKRHQWINEHMYVHDIEIYWGTNESVYLSASDLKEFLDEARRLTPEQYETIIALTGRGFGYCNWFEEFVQAYEEELAYQEDDE